MRRRALAAVAAAAVSVPASGAVAPDTADARCRTLDREQRIVLRAALKQARKLNAPYRARLALVEAGWVESRLRRLTWGDADSEGYLQLRVGLWGRQTARSVRRSTRAFLRRGFTGRGGAIRLARRTNLMSGQIAQAVQGSAFPRRYQQVRPLAQRLIKWRSCQRP